MTDINILAPLIAGVTLQVVAMYLAAKLKPLAILCNFSIILITIALGSKFAIINFPDGLLIGTACTIISLLLILCVVLEFARMKYFANKEKENI